MIADGVLEDALEQQRQLGGGPRRVLLGQPQHRVLHDVQRRFLVVDGVDALLESAALDGGEEVGHLLAGGQGSSCIRGKAA